MNLFVLSNDLEKLAKWHVDKHVNKLILEAAQLLCTAAHSVYSGKNWRGYKPVQHNIPLVKWVAASQGNWLWTREYARILTKEWNYRQSHTKEHKAMLMIESLKIPNLPNLGLQPFHQAMPQVYRNENAIIAYKRYYALGKFHLHSWKKRKRPIWIDKYLRECLLEFGALEHKAAWNYYCKTFPHDEEVTYLWRMMKI